MPRDQSRFVWELPARTPDVMSSRSPGLRNVAITGAQHNRWRAVARRLWRSATLRAPGLAAPGLHCSEARRIIRPTDGHTTKILDVISGGPFIKPSHDAQNHARAAKGITPVPTLRGAWTLGLETRERNAIFCAAYVRGRSQNSPLLNTPHVRFHRLQH
jgi:hypothetical protein